MQAIKIVYWRNLLYIPVGSCWLFTFVYSAKIKYLALKSHRRPGDLTVPSAAKVWHLVMPVPTNPCHQTTLESFLDYQNWKYKLLEKLSAKNHNMYFIGLICYYGETVSVCFPAVQVPQQPYTITSRVLSKLLPVMRHEVKQAVITTAFSDAEGRTHPSKKCRREGQKIGGGTLINWAEPQIIQNRGQTTLYCIDAEGEKTQEELTEVQQSCCGQPAPLPRPGSALLTTMRYFTSLTRTGTSKAACSCSLFPVNMSVMWRKVT